MIDQWFSKATSTNLPNTSQNSQCRKLTFNLPKVFVNGNFKMICEVLVLMGLDQQRVIPYNTYSPHREDCAISNPHED